MSVARRQFQPPTPIGEWAEEEVLAIQNELPSIPPYGFFFVTFDNARKRGRGRVVQHCEAWGAKMPESGHVKVDTQELQVRDFTSLQQMEDYLAQYGNYHIDWEGKI